MGLILTCDCENYYWPNRHSISSPIFTSFNIYVLSMLLFFLISFFLYSSTQLFSTIFTQWLLSMVHMFIGPFTARSWLLAVLVGPGAGPAPPSTFSDSSPGKTASWRRNRTSESPWVVWLLDGGPLSMLSTACSAPFPPSVALVSLGLGRFPVPPSSTS